MDMPVMELYELKILHILKAYGFQITINKLALLPISI